MKKILMLPWWLLVIVVIILLLFLRRLWNFLFGERFVPLVHTSSLSQEDAKAYADVLFQAMNQLGTDWADIKQVLSELSEQDYRKVYNAFGVKKYLYFDHDDSGLLGTPLDLRGWFLKELDYFSKEHIRNKYPWVKI